MADKDAKSAIEKLLGFEFVSDPRKARFPIPEVPKGHPKDRPYPFPAMQITPEMAKDVLKFRVIRMEVMPRTLRHPQMTGNRRFLMAALKGSRHDKGWIRRFKDKEMHPGTTDTVSFTPDGFLLDGQHRFAACYLSRVPFEVPPMVNTPWDTFSVKDTGRGRTPGQLLGEVPYADSCAAAAKLILPVLYGSERKDWISTTASNQEIYDLVHGWPFFHESWNEGGSWMREVLAASARRIPPTALAASIMMALAAGADPFHVQSFLEALKPSYREGFPKIGERGEDPRYLLRRTYMNRVPKGKATTDRERRQQVGHVRKALSIWLDYQGGHKMTELTRLPTTPDHADLPEVWFADAVRKFHREKVS
ncbi:hypothetical protein [Streptomyces cucumeris]|uniref:hypothetical protein n=1 Tax=Streptomyces cucumeris TaxID=2962890 RepID=UPI0020C8CB7F|nr:hypothetical protein [Streptomyces sp. NEAU-Y11]MCP9209611.1 hypothetical protein [Streptomyces sp. NEAU-Y11]